MECQIVVREATERDMEARAELVRQSITEYDLDAFLLFFFQELTLQVCVLCGAVLFIFCGAAPAACACVLPAAAGAVAAAVLATHRALAHTHVQRVRKEVRGFVAECGGGAGRVVGTASVSACWGARRAGWLHALGVSRAWRRRGAGAALLAACRAHAQAAGLHALETRASELQGGARALLHAAGWEVRGSYARPVLGAAPALHVTRLSLELPHA